MSRRRKLTSSLSSSNLSSNDDIEEAAAAAAAAGNGDSGGVRPGGSVVVAVSPLSPYSSLHGDPPLSSPPPRRDTSRSPTNISFGSTGRMMTSAIRRAVSAVEPQHSHSGSSGNYHHKTIDAVRYSYTPVPTKPIGEDEYRILLPTAAATRRWSRRCKLLVVTVVLVMVVGYVAVVSLTAFAVPYTACLRHHASADLVLSSSSFSSSNTTDSAASAAFRLAPTSLVQNVKQGAVASDQAVCSRLGVETLQKGGNAVDAAVTVALCLGVAGPASSGLGGGAFLLIHASPNNHHHHDDDATTNNHHHQLPEFIDARTTTTTTTATITTPSPHQSQSQSLHSSSEKVTEVVDCRERAPGGASTDMFDGLPIHASVYGGLSIAVLGELKCLELAHARFGGGGGKLPWSALVEPVIALAETGVPVGFYLAKQIAATARKFSHRGAEYDNYGLRKFLTVSDDWQHPLREGDLLRNVELAETLRAIAVGGADALYRDRAAQLAAEIQAAGGIVTADDIRHYRATLRSPVVARHVRGFALLGVPPPSSGGAVILGAARFLAGFSTPLASLADTVSAHRLVEACKHVFAIRMSLSDPDYNTKSVRSAVYDLASGPYMENLRHSYYRDNVTQPLSKYGGDKWAQLKDGDGVINVTDAKEGDRRRKNRRRLQRSFGYLEDHGTSHFSVVDRDGNAVSMTSSVNTHFGSSVRSPSTGIIFSNTMDDFSKPGLPNHFGLRPSESNYIKPGKQPLSSMSPTLVFREMEEDADSDASSGKLGDLVLVIGASGGPKIITSVLQVLLNFIMLGKPLLESILHARLHAQLIYHGASVTAAEKAQLASGPTIDVSARTRDALKVRGHQLLNIDFPGSVQAIAIDLETKQLAAASDPRKGGSPAGY